MAGLFGLGYGTDGGWGYPGSATVAAFDPSTVPGLTVWGKADGTLWQDDARTSAVTADGQTVGAADDITANANHLLQATAGKRPAYKINIQNGKPGLLFTKASAQYLAKAGILANQPWYALIVAQPTFDPSATVGDLCDKQNIGSRRLIRAQSGGSRVVSVAAGTVRGTVAQNTTYVFGGGIDSGASCFASVNGTEYAAEDLGSDNGGSGTALGINGDLASFAWGGYIFEWMFFDNIPAAGTRTNLINYLNGASRWSVF